jgi:aconitate hydratase
MGAELGATCSVFPYDGKMKDFLEITGRAGIASEAEMNRTLLTSDDEVSADPGKFYDRVIEIDLESLEPLITGPHSPDAVTSLSDMKDRIRENGWPAELSSGLIGSCTNSSYEDMDRSASVISQALKAGLKFSKPFFVSPGSSQVKSTIRENGQMKIMEDAGAVVLSNACGPCIGQWQRKDIKKGERNSIINSFNRNFRARNDGNPETLSFISSPELATVLTIAGRLDFDPRKDTLESADGKVFIFQPPEGDEIPPKGFLTVGDVYQEPEGPSVTVRVNPGSDRIQLLTPFSPWDGNDSVDCLLLAKAKGKCTTDHISPAGKWLKYRGHLENISGNMLAGAVNAFTGNTGTGSNILTGEKNIPFPGIAESYKSSGHRWVIVGDENYGEGSSREHAAMSPRFLGCAAVIVRSFARIHETNLKKQGILALTFADPSDYDRIGETDRVTITGLSGFAPEKDLKAVITDDQGNITEITLKHTFNTEQISWFRAGSALNKLRENNS